MALEMDDEWPEKLLRGWAKAYRETPEYRFSSDPSAEFFPVDMETAADEIARLRAVEMAAQRATGDVEEMQAIRRLLGIDGQEMTALDVLRAHPDWQS